MPFNFEHDNDQQSQIALNLLLALLPSQQQGPPQQSAPQQSPTADLISQIAPLTAARANGSAPVNSYAGGDGGQASYHGSSHRTPSYSSYGGDSSGSVNGYDRLVNQDALAQYRAQQSDQRLGERSQDQANLREQQDADAMNREQSHDLPQWIQQGLANQTYRYTPDQKRMMEQDQAAHVRVDNDPTFSPDDRARMHAKIAQHDRQNRLNVQRTPQDELPISPQQQAQQSSWQEVDPISGLTVTKTFGPMRNGDQGPPVLDPVSEAHLKDWQDQQKHNRAAQLKQMELDQKNNDAQAKAAVVIENHRKYVAANRQKLMGSIPKSQKEVREAEEQYNMVFGETQPKDKNGAAIPITEDDRDAAQKRLMEARANHEALLRELDGVNNELGSLVHPAAIAQPEITSSDQSGMLAEPDVMSAMDSGQQPDQPPQQFPTVSKAEDYAAIPSGQNAQYYDPQGNLRTKR